MKVISITAGGKELKYKRDFNAIFVEMPEKIKAGTTGELTVNYYGKPTIAKRPPWMAALPGHTIIMASYG